MTSAQPKFFIGLEAEGPHRGMRTLFIRGDVTSVPELSSLLSTTFIEQIYLGAGNIRGANPAVMRAVRKLVVPILRRIRVTIECDKMEQVFNIVPELMKLRKTHHAVSVVFTVDTEDSLADMDWITDVKFVNQEELVWHHVEKAYRTKLNDELYSTDKEVLL